METTHSAAQLNGAFFILEKALIFRITGKDASRYLNARLSNNIRDLAPNQGCAAAALSPQGRTELFGTVLKFSAEDYLFIADGGDAEAVGKTLAQYKVADRVDFNQQQEVSLLHLIDRDLFTIAGQQYKLASVVKEFTPSRAEHISFYPHIRTPQAGYDIIIATQLLNEVIQDLTQSGCKMLSDDEQKFARIMAKRPQFPLELNDESIFLEAGLGHAVSFTKGCYVGQEVLEKVDSHGRLPFSLVSLISSHSIQSTPPSESLVTCKSNPDQNCGEVIASVLNRQRQQSVCFARLKTKILLETETFLIANQEFRLV